MTAEKVFSGEIAINAPRAKVWEALSAPESASQWAGVFGGDLPSFSGEWKEGGEWLAWDENGDGLVARFLRCVPEEIAEFEHVAGLKKHERCELAGTHAEWKGLREVYALADAGGKTALSVRSELPDSCAKLMSEKWPRVLEKIKELAEKTS